MSSKNILVDPNTGKEYHIGGCLINKNVSDLPKFGASRKLASNCLPPSVDLRQLMTPVEYQGDTNSCVGNALAGAYEFLIMKHHKKQIDVSRLFIYYNGRCEDGLEEYNMKDSGSSIRGAIAALAKFGCCKEPSYPYVLENLNRKPPSHCYNEGKRYRITNAISIGVDIDEMRACLAEGFPFAFGLRLFQSFLEGDQFEGRISLPQSNESQSNRHGWHSMLAVGYSDPSECFIVRNSWGEKWGDKGYCYIPYAYMCNGENCSDLHAIKIVTDQSQNETKTIDSTNSYNWNIDKDRKDSIPTDYPYPEFGKEFFWKRHDGFNYFKTIFKKGKAVPFSWKKTHSNPNTPKIFSSKSPISSALWIDEKTEENLSVLQELTKQSSLYVQFCQTISQAQTYLLEHSEEFQNSSHCSFFQIIARGYYKDEDQNVFDLLHFMNKHGFDHIPILVFTRDKSRLEHYLGKYASELNIQHWKQRLIITDNVQQLIEKSKENINKHY